MAEVYMVIDVESIGLHGEGYAFGAVVIDSDGNKLDELACACDPAQCNGPSEGHIWTKQNAPKLKATHSAAWLMRSTFWNFLRHWADQKALIVADCGWPVEARFLAACVDDSRASRDWTGPYPMHELASFLVAAGMDPMARHDREPDELPVHNPLADAKQSARLLLLALQKLRGPNAQR